MSVEALPAAIVANWRREDPAGWLLYEHHIAPHIGTLGTEGLPQLHGNPSPSPEEIARASIARYTAIRSWRKFDTSNVNEIADDPAKGWPWGPREIPRVIAQSALACVIPAATADPPKLKICGWRDDHPDPLPDLRLAGAEMLSAARLRFADGTEREIATLKLLALTRPDLSTVVAWLKNFAEEHRQPDGAPLRLKGNDNDLRRLCMEMTGTTDRQFKAALRKLPPEYRFTRGHN